MVSGGRKEGERQRDGITEGGDDVWYRVEGGVDVAVLGGSVAILYAGCGFELDDGGHVGRGVEFREGWGAEERRVFFATRRVRWKVALVWVFLAISQFLHSADVPSL